MSVAKIQKQLELVDKTICNSQISFLRSRSGFTLIELMVYIAILGIVVLVAGQAYSDSTRMRIRTQSMLTATQTAENIGTLLRNDVAQMGAKSAKSETSSGFFFTPLVYMDSTKDSSSYSITDSSLTFRRIHYGDNGEYLRVEEVVWEVDSKNSFSRTCKTISGTDDDECSNDGTKILIADSVSEFKTMPSVPGILLDTATLNDVLFPRNASLTDKSFKIVSYYGVNNYSRLVSMPAEGGLQVKLAGLKTNFGKTISDSNDVIKYMAFLGSVSSTGDGWSNCHRIQFKKDSTYEISFNMINKNDQARNFQPGVDHFSVGIRENNNGTPVRVNDVPDFHFYPPENDAGDGKRVMRFSSHKEDFYGCVSLSLMLFSPTANLGSFVLSDVMVRRVGDMDYTFDESLLDVPLVDKKNVRAFRIKLSVRKNGETGKTVIDVPVSSNGVKG